LGLRDGDGDVSAGEDDVGWPAEGIMAGALPIQRQRLRGE
jgi:hypothetical protein